MPENQINSSTEATKAEEAFMNSDQSKETNVPDETDELDTEPKPVSHGKRALVWALLILGSWALVLGIGYLVYRGLSQSPATAAAPAPAATVTISNGGRTITVPAVRGVNATDCTEDDLVLEGNRLVFKNGCAKPVFYEDQ